MATSNPDDSFPVGELSLAYAALPLIPIIVGDVLPLIHAELPDVKLHIVGSEMPEEIEQLASERVVVHGYVEDVEPLFERSRLSVAPLRYGSGVKGKVNQSMSLGVPCVATSIAAEGIEAKHGEEIVIADGAESFAAAVLDLYQDDDAWRAISEQSVRCLDRTFSRAVAEQHLQDIVRDYVSGAPEPKDASARPRSRQATKP